MHTGRTFTCTLEARPSTPNDAWWWFGVSGDKQRYAIIHAASNETRESVKRRIITYYDNLIDRRSRPLERPHHWSHRGRPRSAPATPANEIAPEPDKSTDTQ